MSYLYGKPGPSEPPGPAPEGMRWHPKMSGGYWEEIEERTNMYTYYEYIGGDLDGERWFFRRDQDNQVTWWDGDYDTWIPSAYSDGYNGWPYDEDEFRVRHAPVDEAEVPEEARA